MDADDPATWDAALRPRLRLDEVLAESSRLHSSREAIVDDDGAVTYAELDALVDGLADALRQGGVKAGHRVATAISTGRTAVIALYAISRCGATAVPLNEFWTAPEIADALGRSAASHLLHDRQLGAPGAPAAVALQLLGDAPAPARGLVGADASLDWLHVGPPRTPEEGRDIALLLFTSGSTATPKGARLHHEGLVGVAHYVRLASEMTAEDRYLHLMPLYHVGGIVEGLLPPHLAGAACVLTRFDPQRCLELLEEQRITVTTAFDSMLDALMRADGYRPERHARWQAAGISGSPQTYDRLRGAGVTRIFVGFGMTETCGDLTFTRPWQDEEAKRTSLGPVIPGLEARVVDPSTGTDAASGAIGELRVRGWSLFRGYIDGTDGLDELGYFRSGDLVRMRPGGDLEFHGRIKHMIKSGGENVSAFEVEEFLVGLPEIQAAVVVGVPDERWGEMVVAFVESASGDLDVADLKAHCKEQLAGFKIPKHFILVGGDRWPLMAAGKIDRPELTRMAAARVAETTAS